MHNGRHRRKRRMDSDGQNRLGQLNRDAVNHTLRRPVETVLRLLSGLCLQILNRSAMRIMYRHGLSLRSRIRNRIQRRRNHRGEGDGPGRDLCLRQRHREPVCPSGNLQLRSDKLARVFVRTDDGGTAADKRFHNLRHAEKCNP